MLIANFNRNIYKVSSIAKCKIALHPVINHPYLNQIECSLPIYSNVAKFFKNIQNTILSGKSTFSQKPILLNIIKKLIHEMIINIVYFSFIHFSKKHVICNFKMFQLVESGKI